MSGSTEVAGPNPLVVGAVGVIVGTSVVVGLIWLGILSAGDESPIRVKNQSIDLELLNKGHKWKENGDKKHWKPKTGTRNSDDYELYISPSNPGDCTGGLNPKGQTVRFGFSDLTYVELQSQSKKTNVTATVDLEKSADEMTVSHKADGYISLISVNTTDVCTFKAKDSKLRVLVIDP